MVSPPKLVEFQKLLNSTGINYEIIIDDVQHLIDQENSIRTDEDFSFKKYHTLDEIYEWMESLSSKYPEKVCNLFFFLLIDLCK